MSEHEHSPQCQQLLGSLSDYIDGELQAELCAELEQHIQDCDNCRIVVNTLRKTIELYQQTNPTAELPDELRERLFFKLHLEDYLKRA
jgi:anti-sigma factor (TIGR02949 family)